MRTSFTAYAAPYAVAVYFVLFLAARASAEFVQPADLVVPLVLACVVASAGHAAGWLLTRSPVKAAAIGVLTSLVFSTTGYIVTPLVEAYPLRLPGGTWIPIGLIAVITVAGTLVISRTPRRLDRLLAAFTWVAVGLSLFNLSGASALTRRTRSPGRLHPSSITASAPVPGARPPDIYLIVLDKYAGSDVLAGQYGFDNGEFTRFLRRRGFVVPAVSRANYVQTFLSLASMLNAEYLDWLPDSLGADNPRWSAAYHLVEDNRVASFLRERGYRFVFLPTALGVTRRNRYADVQIPDPGDIRPEFVTAWLLTTAAPILQFAWCRMTGCPQSGGPYVPETASMFDWKFEAIAKLAGVTQPQFVLAHLTVPHEPYVYQADCRHRTPYWPLHDLGDEAPRVRSAYLDQIRCVNRKVTDLVIRIQERSTVPPIILIQGDHGHGLLGRNLPPLSKVAAWQVADRTSAFGAYAVPGMPDSVLADSTTPINVMRAVLRFTFGAELPPVRKATYWSSYDRPYRYTRVY